MSFPLPPKPPLDERSLLAAIAGHLLRIEREAVFIRGMVYYLCWFVTLAVICLFGLLAFACGGGGANVALHR